MTCLLFVLKILVIFHAACSIETTENIKHSRPLYSSSVMGMTKLLQMENELLSDLKNYAREMQHKLDMITLYQEMLRRPAMHDPRAQEAYVGNPLNALGLVRRLQQDWPKWLTYLQGGTTHERVEQMRLKLEKSPSDRDLHLAIDGLLRIESYYDLEASHMAKGLLLNKQFDAQLDPADCFALGSQLFNHTEYSKSTHWFRTALRLYKQPYGKLYGQVLGLKRKKLYRSYAMAIAKETHSDEEPPKHATPAEWQEMADKMLNQLVLNATNADIKKLIDEYLAGEEQIFIKERAKHKPKMTSLQRGCRGLWPERQPHRLTCRYFQHNSAFLKLAPVKMEILNERPLIVLYHQVLADSVIDTLRSAAINQTAKDFEMEAAKLFPLAQLSESLKLKLKRRLQPLLFDITDSTLHLYNYGLGGYLPRYSKSTCRGAKIKTKSKNSAGSIEIDLKERCHSQRVGTILFYASDVPLGGATIFPNLKLLVQPQKGSALVWINRDAELKPEKLTEHAVCPVALGSRWVISNCIGKDRVLDEPCLA